MPVDVRALQSTPHARLKSLGLTATFGAQASRGTGIADDRQSDLPQRRVSTGKHTFSPPPRFHPSGGELLVTYRRLMPQCGPAALPNWEFVAPIENETSGLAIGGSTLAVEPRGDAGARLVRCSGRSYRIRLVIGADRLTFDQWNT